MFRALQAAFVVVACTLYLGTSCAQQNPSTDAARREKGTPQEPSVGETAERAEHGSIVPDRGGAEVSQNGRIATKGTSV